MFYWYNKEVKRKKMKKIAIAFGIIACLAVLSMLLTSASAEEEGEEWLRCPGGGWKNLSGYYMDPTKVHYEKYIEGIGYEDCRARIATHTWNAGLGASTSSRGSARIYQDYQTFDVDTHPTNPRLNSTSVVDKSYRNVTFGDWLVKPLNRSLSGENCVKSYMVGAMVSERYMDTHDIIGAFNHTGNATYSSTTMNRYIYGTSRFAVTVKDPTDFKHTIMRAREEYTGKFDMLRNVTVERYGDG